MKVTTLKIEIEDDGEWSSDYDNLSLVDKWKAYLETVVQDEPIVIISVELVSEGDV